MNHLIILFSAFIFSSFSVLSQQEDVVALKKEVDKAKKELKSSIKEQGYDGSKITYYQIKNEDDFKELEVHLFLRDHYTLHFNGDASSGKIKMRIFDKPAHDPNRIQLFEVRNISGKTIEVTEKELNEKLGFYVPDAAPLRSIFVEYEISKGRSKDRGAVVMMLGYTK